MILYLDMVAYEDKLLVQKKIMNLKANSFNLYKYMRDGFISHYFYYIYDTHESV